LWLATYYVENITDLNYLQESRCAYVLVVMAILWLTEALPIPVTALMPVFLIPMFGVLPGKTICAAYVNVRGRKKLQLSELKF
jgi:di/tricarboxylate transporter